MSCFIQSMACLVWRSETQKNTAPVGAFRPQLQDVPLLSTEKHSNQLPA